MRISFYAGPGAGKSFWAKKATVELAERGYTIELVREWVKEWAFLKRQPRSFDALYIFSNQLHLEDTMLQCGVPIIATESPPLLAAAYSDMYSAELTPAIEIASRHFEKRYPSINILLKRGDLYYKEEGRYQNKDEAAKLDDDIQAVLDRNEFKYAIFNTKDKDGILNYIETRLENWANKKFDELMDDLISNQKPQS